jgi:hypothetical protein
MCCSAPTVLNTQALNEKDGYKRDRGAQRSAEANKRFAETISSPDHFPNPAVSMACSRLALAQRTRADNCTDHNTQTTVESWQRTRKSYISHTPPRPLVDAVAICARARYHPTRTRTQKQRGSSKRRQHPRHNSRILPEPLKSGHCGGSGSSRVRPFPAYATPFLSQANNLPANRFCASREC